MWITERFNVPNNILMHRQGDPVKIYASELDPYFARVQFGHPLALAFESLCGQILDKVGSGEVRPEYISFPHYYCPSVKGTHCQAMCMEAVLGLRAQDAAGEMQPMYRLERTFSGNGIVEFEDYDGAKTLADKEFPLFKLNEGFSPY